MNISNSSTVSALLYCLEALGSCSDKSRILDCCAGDTGIVFSLMQHFQCVSSNDKDPRAQTQTHYDVATLDFWNLISDKYDGIVTKPPVHLIETIVSEAFRFGVSFCALLIDQKEMSRIKDVVWLKSSSVIYIGFQYAWLLWFNMVPRNFIVCLSKEDMLQPKKCIRDITQKRMNESYRVMETLNLHTAPNEFNLKDKFKQDTNYRENTSCVKAIIAAQDGKDLELQIDKFKSQYTKKEVITKICKMKYRSAQRKLRIAKYIEKYPEISNMTQRQAEKFISEQQKKISMEKKYILD